MTESRLSLDRQVRFALRSATDERSVAVALTVEGRDLQVRARHMPDRMASATGLEIGEPAELRCTLDRLAAALDAAAQRQMNEK
ncbi:hypothetical protein MOQ72_04710 [Saccharopolyspora sp. K220]|uniref:hypothetical protein n=1 Tax=Saccharopolyspora soli TaxID=2926618 RepID=UPI001F59BEE9|nr:hypothetical protein [Saccharopolyspora soli]MCI2416715.1 hypothetical protein [Saccharopolyspora soli]